MKATLFNIQKFSLHDGPGIRTVVFLKGCPLSCKWCSNPESQLREIQILRNSSCSSCGACVEACPQGAMTLEGVNIHRCTGCKACVEVCPHKALTVEGEETDIDRVLQICLQDLPFYEESGGGVTVSGGECLSSPEFTKALIEALHRENIHVALETTGYTMGHIFRDVALKADLLLFDLKHHDSRTHHRFTGVDTDMIIRNLKAAIDSGIEVLPRIPVIPGFNNSLEDAAKLSELLLSVGAKKVQLLPFHQFGESKYRSLGRAYSYKDVPALHEEDLQDYIRIFREKGLEAFF